MSIRTMETFGVFLKTADRFSAGGCSQHVHAATFENGRKRKDISGVVVNQQYRFADESVVRYVETLKHPLLFDWQIARDHAVEK